MAYRKTCIWKYFFAWLLISYASTTYAGGFYLATIGTPGSLGTAGVANPTNTFGADASFTNPARMKVPDHDSIAKAFDGFTVCHEFAEVHHVIVPACE